MTRPEASPALVDEQQRIRQDLDELRRRVFALGRSYASMSEARIGWFERGRILEDLVVSIASDGRPVGRLTWHAAADNDG